MHKIVMIGEASHGTHEFYKTRAELTKRLIEQKGFNFVAIEGDWPDSYRINRFVCNGLNGKDTSSREALADFARFPKWMWRNNVIEEFVSWLRSYNDTKPSLKHKTRFYGLDLYSLFRSADEVIRYLEKVSPKDAQLAKERYGTLNIYRDDEFQYTRDLAFELTPSKEKEVVAMLKLLLSKAPEYIRTSGGFLDGDELFYSIQNARVVKDAEEYYRKGFAGGTVTWNLRDKHMVDTLQQLFDMHKNNLGQPKPKAIIWAHNSHLGDSRAFKENRVHGKWNVGQLVRERFGTENSFCIGFTTFSGTVTAAQNWGDESKKWDLTPALDDSYESLLHKAIKADFWFLLRSNKVKIRPNDELVKALRKERSERLVGVMYVKQRERSAHYQEVCLPDQFDAVIHYDISKALQQID